jgi:hypothetical protein
MHSRSPVSNPQRAPALRTVETSKVAWDIPANLASDFRMSE